MKSKEATALTCRIKINNTLWPGWQKYVNELPVYMDASVANPELAAKHLTGNGLDHVHSVMQHLSTRYNRISTKRILNFDHSAKCFAQKQKSVPINQAHKFS